MASRYAYSIEFLNPHHMLLASVVTSVLLICAAIAHFITAFYFRTKVMLQPDEVEPENDYELASIVMAVRGCDPGFL